MFDKALDKEQVEEEGEEEEASENEEVKFEVQNIINFYLNPKS